MIQHTWKKLDTFPLVFVVVLAFGIFVPCMIALNYGHVSPYVPYISEGGGEFPEAGIFSVFICISSFLCQWILMIRYILVQEMNSNTGNDMNGFLNKISLAIGGLATVALIVVAAYPASTITQVHNSAAGVACVCYVTYLICHTIISFRLLGRTKISYFRLVITICSTVALILVTTFGLIGSSQWTEDYWAGKKKPEDKGFISYVISAASEWAMALLLIIFFSTYVPEFRKASLHFHVETAGKEPNKPSLSGLDIRHR